MSDSIPSRGSRLVKGFTAVIDYSNNDKENIRQLQFKSCVLDGHSIISSHCLLEPWRWRNGFLASKSDFLEYFVFLGRSL